MERRKQCYLGNISIQNRKLQSAYSQQLGIWSMGAMGRKRTLERRKQSHQPKKFILCFA